MTPNHPGKPGLQAAPAAVRFDTIAALDLATLTRGDLDLTPIECRANLFRRFAMTHPDRLAAHARGADCLILNKVRLDAEFFSRHHPSLVCLAATGSDNIDLDAARSAGVAVTNIRNYCTESVVQHVFSLVLALRTHLLDYHNRLLSGAWSRSPTFTLLDYPIAELQGQTLAIIGYGTLGRAVAAQARQWGMTVLISERRGHRAPRRERIEFEAALARADIVSLHAPLTGATRGLIDTTALRLMRPGALLINTARGALVDEQALAQALRRGHLGGAGLDVLSAEPPPADHPLLDARLPNCIVTPHIAWAAREARQRAIEQIGMNIADYLAGGSRNRLV